MMIIKLPININHKKINIMPEFKDISIFNQVTPVGTERIQVSAANCVTLMDIANLGSKTNWYTELDKRITQNKNDALAAYELANNANNKAVEAMGDAESALNGVSTVRSQVVTVSNSYKLYQVIIISPVLLLRLH